MKTASILILCASCAFAAFDVYVYDSASGERAPKRLDSGIVVVDLARPDRMTSPEYRPWMKRLTTPCLADPVTRNHVPWVGTATGSVAAASASARAALRDYLGTNTYHEARATWRSQVNAATTNGTTLGQVRDALDALLRLERLEVLKRSASIERLEGAQEVQE